ncbi:DNA glycosylase AlkZ-like family protein [Bacillus mycoides]|jgi:hypothetical protein|uniref:DNA glycosylase AlkZ-like family protein n=1 Tax=Bacillus mycoides TaxID=1405 RepID=UPI003D660A32
MNTYKLAVDKTTIKRFLLQKQGLWNQLEIQPSADSDTTLSIIRKLECIQLDPVAAVERNHHLVLHARNTHYQNQHLENLLSTREVFEYVANAACIIPMDDFAIFEPIREYYGSHIHNSTQNLEPVMEKIMTRLLKEGPLPSRSFQSITRVKGYWDTTKASTKETTLALNILFDLGKITVANRIGNEKFFALSEINIPQNQLFKSQKIDNDEAKEALIQKYMRAYRVFDFEDPRFGWYKTTAKERKNICNVLLKKREILPLQIEGVNRQYYILSQDQECLTSLSCKKNAISSSNSIKFLPPLDNLLWRRTRLEDIFDFSYKWEIYFPASKRKFGYYAMPILYGDSIIGRIDPKYIRDEKTLSIRLLQLEDHIKINKMLLRSLEDGLRIFKNFHNANHLIIEKTHPKSLLNELHL